VFLLILQATCFGSHKRVIFRLVLRPSSYVPVFDRPAGSDYRWTKQWNTGKHRRIHTTVVWLAGNLPAGCQVAPRAIHYYARSPAGSSVNSGAHVAYRHVPTLWILPGQPNNRVVWICLYSLCSTTLSGDNWKLRAGQKPRRENKVPSCDLAHPVSSQSVKNRNVWTSWHIQLYVRIY
jgi:hypothetical protein